MFWDLKNKNNVVNFFGNSIWYLLSKKTVQDQWTFFWRLLLKFLKICHWFSSVFSCQYIEANSCILVGCPYICGWCQLNIYTVLIIKKGTWIMCPLFYEIKDRTKIRFFYEKKIWYVYYVFVIWWIRGANNG